MKSNLDAAVQSPRLALLPALIVTEQRPQPATARLPNALVAALCLFHFLLWVLVASLFTQGPPSDNLEQLVWAQDLAWGYAKHPPLPAWLLYGLTQLFGFDLPVTYFAGAACASASLALLYSLARQFVSAERAAIATFLCSLIVYFSCLSGHFNYNTVQLPLAVAVIGCFYVALRDGAARAWVALGVLSALMMLTKYSALVLFAAFAIFLVTSHQIRERRIHRGLALT